MNSLVRHRGRRGRSFESLCLTATLSSPLIVSPAASAATITPPDMKLQVLAGQISHGTKPSNGHPQLQFTDVTWDAGAGPFEIGPTCNRGHRSHAAEARAALFSRTHRATAPNRISCIRGALGD